MAIRRVVLTLLAGVDATDAVSSALQQTNDVAWSLFLRAECCATRVGALLRRHRLLDRMPHSAIAVLRAAELRELQRALSARAQLRQLDQIAYAAGVSATVLKGGTLVGEGIVVDLGDLDIAASPDGSTVLAAALLRAGYVAPAAAPPLTPPTRGASREAVRPFGDHLPRLEIAGGLPVELHELPSRTTLRAGEQTPTALHAGPELVPLDVSCAPAASLPTDPTRALRGFRSLRRRVGGAALEEMLRHVVVQHPFRRGHIRDLLVLTDAIGECSAADVESVRDRCRTDPHGAELIDMLDQGLALTAGTPVADSDSTRRIVARKYGLAGGREAWVTRAVPRWPGKLAYVPLERTPLRWAELASLVRDGRLEHSAYAFPLVRRRAPRLAAAMGTVVATVYRVLLATVIVLAGPRIRGRVRHLTAGPDGLRSRV